MEHNCRVLYVQLSFTFIIFSNNNVNLSIQTYMSSEVVTAFVETFNWKTALHYKHEASTNQKGRCYQRIRWQQNITDHIIEPPYILKMHSVKRYI